MDGVQEVPAEHLVSHADHAVPDGALVDKLMDLAAGLLRDYRARTWQPTPEEQTVVDAVGSWV